MATTKKQLVNFDQFIKYHFMLKYNTNNLGQKHFLIIYPRISKSIRQEGLSWWRMLVENICWWKTCMLVKKVHQHESMLVNMYEIVCWYFHQHTGKFSPKFIYFSTNIHSENSSPTYFFHQHISPTSPQPPRAGIFFFKSSFSLGVILYRG